MKKGSLLLLLILILPICLVFSGCKDKEKRTVLEFYSHYLEIADSNTKLVRVPLGDKFTTNLSLHKVGFVYSSEMQQKMQNVDAYSKIDSMYNVMLEDALGPTFMFSQTLSSAKISDNEKAKMYKYLDDLKSGYIDIALRLQDLEINLTNETAPQNLEKLYQSYEGTIDTSTKLSSLISKIYYNDILLDSNVNYYNQQENLIDLSDLAVRARNKLVYFKSVYVDIYLHTSIIGYDIPSKIVDGTFNATYTPYDNLKNETYSTISYLTLETRRSELVELGRELYLLQKSFDQEYQKYRKAITSITYVQVNETSSTFDKAYKEFIDAFSTEGGIVYSSYETLKSILDICCP